MLRSDLGDRLVLTGFALGSLDALDRELVSDDPATATSEQIDRRSLRAAVALRRDRDDGYDSAMLWGGRDRSFDDYAFGLVPASLHQDTWVAGARAAQQTRFADRATLTIGADVDGAFADLSRAGSQSIPAREGDVHIFGLPPGDDVAADQWTATTVDSAAHAMTDVAIGPVIATAGVRVDGWLTGASHIVPTRRDFPPVAEQDMTVTADPRGSVQATIAPGLVLRADAGRYHEARQASDTSAVFGTPSLGIEEAWHATAGGQWRATGAPIALEAAAYLRDLDDLVARDGRVTPPVAHLLTMAGTGRVRGVEVTAARRRAIAGCRAGCPTTCRAAGATTTSARARRFFDHDQTHGLVAVAGWERGPWTLGARVRFATGEPRTGVVGAFFDTRTGRFDPILGAANGERLPAYFAADARAERRFPLRGAKGAVYVELQNITDRANAEEIIYNADFTQEGLPDGIAVPGDRGTARWRNEQMGPRRAPGLAACDHALDPARLAIIDQPRLLAIVADPTEVKPGATVTYTPLVATPDGPLLADPPHWAFCTAGKPPSEDNAVAPACLGDGALVDLGTSPTVTATIPMDACATFGPDVPSSSGSGAGTALRPRDPDPTGGYYQPVRADVDDLQAFAMSRITCNLPTAPNDVAHDYQTMYVANAAPALAPLAMHDAATGEPIDPTAPIAAGRDVALVASWPAGAAEDYLWYDPVAQALVTRHEGMRVSWFATGGAIDVDSSGVAEDDPQTLAVSTTWHAPTEPGPTWVFLVLRDTRGGLATQTIALTVR